MIEEFNKNSSRDFFISYISADRLWAEWIAWHLEQEGYLVDFQIQDFRPGQSFAQSIQAAIKSASHTIAVLSPDYLDILEKHVEWSSILRPDPTNEQGILLPVQVRECRNQLRASLPFITYIDLVGQNEEEARKSLLTGINRIRSKPLASTKHPDVVAHSVVEQPRFPASLPAIWNVPPHNPFFTDRKETLQHLHSSFAALNTQEITHPQAISGLGGIGKTQIAIEYAHRNSSDYGAVLWASADSRDTFITSCLNIAQLLDLPKKNVQDHAEIVSALRNWLQDHIDWLLILDNADDPYIVRDFLPSTAKGHVLITTRAQAMGRIARGIVIDKMTPKEGALFLLLRAGMLGLGDAFDDNDSNFQSALRIAQIMDGLPLALDQAGAYIEETGCGLDDYLTLYETHHRNLLQLRGRLIFDHPEPVATTWELSFKQVQQANPAAAKLLRLYAFLSPDEIPEEIITEGAADLDPEFETFTSNPLTINDAIAELRKYSLVRRHPENKTLSMHRLVQVALIDTMKEDAVQQWAERAVHLINRAFPSIEFENWTRCDRMLPHALCCAYWIDRFHLTFHEGARLLNQTGYYLSARARYSEAEPLLQRALAISEQQLGPLHPDTATSLNNLASLYQQQGKFTEAEPLLQRALAITEQQLGPLHFATATSLNNLASLYQDQGRLAEAEPLLQRALDIAEQQLGPLHPDTAQRLNNLASLYRLQGQLAEAEPLLQRAVDIDEHQLGPLHPDTATSLSNLALLHQDQGRLAEAEPLLQRALAIDERIYGPSHPEVATDLSNLALLYQDQGRFTEVESLLQRALTIDEYTYGKSHPEVATDLNNLALLYRQQGKLSKAEPLYQRALAISEQHLGPLHPHTTVSLNNLALLYRQQDRLAEAEPLLQRALAIREQQMGPSHPTTALSLNNLASLYQLQGKLTEAEPLLQRALAIDEQQLGLLHPATATNLNNLASIYRQQGKLTEAEPLLQRALAIDEQTFGPNHPSTATSLNNIARLFQQQGKLTEAEPLLQRALAIREQALGPEHPYTAATLNNIAGLYLDQGKPSDAEPLVQRALSIRESVLGSDHPDTIRSLTTLARIYNLQGNLIEAEPFYRRALFIFTERLGPKHPDTVSTLRDLVSLLREMQQDSEVAQLEARIEELQDDEPEKPSGAV